MKAIHTSILDVLSNYFTWSESIEIANNVLEYGADNLRFNLVDHIVDYYVEADAEEIADECINNL